MSEPQTQESTKIKRTTSNDKLKEKKIIQYLINDYFTLIVWLDKNPKKDKWQFFDLRNKKIKPTITGNIRESPNARDRFIKDVASLGIMEKDGFRKILIEACSNITSLINELEVFDEESTGYQDSKESSLIFGDNGEIYEEVYDGKNVRFVSLNDTNPKFFDSVGDISPIMGEEVIKLAIVLPDEPKEYNSTEELIKNIEEHINRYLDIPDDYRKIATYYILMSWLYEKINTLPYLRAMGDSGTGKSRMLDVIGRLLYKPSMVAGAITPAPIYRLLDKWRGSLIIDEGDFKDSSEQNEVITILNCGFERNRPIIRCDKDNPDKLRFFNSYGPKIIGTRKPFRDYALESRCITHLSKKTTRRDIPRVLNDEFYDEQEEIRDKLLMFRLRYFNEVDVKSEIDFDFTNIDPRIEQVMRGFLVLFNNISGVKEGFEEFIRKFNERVIEERSESMEGWLINTIVDIIMEKDQDEELNITTTDITDKINDGIKNEKKKKSPITIGKYLRTLGFIVKATKVDGKTKKILLLNSDFLELVKSYVPRDESYENKISRLRLVTGVTVPSLGLSKKLLETTPLNSYISDTLEIGEKKTSVALPSSTVTPETSVAGDGYGRKFENLPLRMKFESWVNSKKHEIHSEKVTELFGITPDEIEKLKSDGLIFELSPGVLKIVL